jgi:hypothetical protein
MDSRNGAGPSVYHEPVLNTVAQLTGVGRKAAAQLWQNHLRKEGSVL